MISPSLDRQDASRHANIAAGLVEVDATFGRMEAFANDLATSHIKKFGAHARPELAFLLSMVDEGDAVFDIGGHIGTFAIPLAQKVGPRGRVLVVEASPANFALLGRNIARLAPSTPVSLVNMIVAPRGQRYALREDPDNTGAHTVFPVSGSEAIAVPTTTLDDLCTSYFTPCVVKIDIEGWEARALSEATRLLASCPIIYAEISHRHLRLAGSSIELLDRLLRDNGYRLFRNIGARNAAHDRFLVTELTTLAEGGDFFDVLAVHSGDDRLMRIINQIKWAAHRTKLLTFARRVVRVVRETFY